MPAKQKPAPVVAPVDPVGEHRARRDKARLTSEVSALVNELQVERARNQFLGLAAKAARTPRILDVSRKHGEPRPVTFVALLSDCHVEETVEPIKVSGRNRYNMEVADARLRRFFKGIVDLVQHHRASKRLTVRDGVLWLGGDLMSGYIHAELAESNAASPNETVVWLLPRLRDGIRSLLEALDLRRLAIPCSYGNHGRTTEKRRVATGAENSFEWLMYKLLEQSFADDARVVFDTTPAPHQYVEVGSRVLHFHHGDSMSYAGGVGGIGIPLLKAVGAWDEVRRADYHHVGHWHQLRDYGRALVNGSLIGYGPYSAWIRAPFEAPQQWFYLLDEERGKCHATPLWVGAPRDLLEVVSGGKAAAAR